MKRVEARKTEFKLLYNEGLTFSDIARRMNICVSEISIYAKEHGIKSHFVYGDKEIHDNFLTYYEQGLNDCAIARVLGKNHKSIQAYRKKLGLKVNRKNRIAIEDLSEKELGIFIGGLLGDSFIQKSSRNTHRGGFAHSLAQEEYFLWKHEELKKFCSKVIKSSQVHTRTKKTYYKVYTHHISGDYLDFLHSVFYTKTIKDLPNFDFIEKHFNDYSLAVWFGDDGSLNSIATNGFQIEVVEKLVNLLNTKYNLNGLQINKRDNSIRISANANRQIAAIAKPILPESMWYKFK